MFTIGAEVKSADMVKHIHVDLCAIIHAKQGLNVAEHVSDASELIVVDLRIVCEVPSTPLLAIGVQLTQIRIKVRIDLNWLLRPPRQVTKLVSCSVEHAVLRELLGYSREHGVVVVDPVSEAEVDTRDIVHFGVDRVVEMLDSQVKPLHNFIAGSVIEAKKVRRGLEHVLKVFHKRQRFFLIAAFICLGFVSPLNVLFHVGVESNRTRQQLCRL